MSDIYPSLTRAGLTQNYLHTNSTTHEFLFGALAELVDNARDAAATKFHVFSTDNKNVRGEFYLNFLDDGEGMDPVDVGNIVQFGKSYKRAAGDHMIGQYGNGLKSGSMRIGNDFILFTKKGRQLTCLMLSRTFHDRESIETIICPMPVWDCDSQKPILQNGGIERYKTEIELILKYSPFKTEHELKRQFDHIKDQTGTLIVIYNLKLLDSGEPELDVRTDETDIRMAEMDPEDDSNWPERVSFKAYASILYLDPRMKIYVQGKKIRTKRLACTLYKPKMYKFTSSRFKKRSEDEVAKADREYRIAEERAREAESTSRDLEKKISLKAKPRKEDRAALRGTQDAATAYRNLAQSKKEEANFKKKALKDRKTLDFVFGFNIESRKYYGMFVYNCSRLIRMYERVGPQVNSGVVCAGVIGVVNVPYLVLEPTHNKQHFADNKEYRHLLKAMGDHLQSYWRDSKVDGKGINNFWGQFGYLNDDWGQEYPSNEPRYQRARAMNITKVIQCDGCLKWRLIPFQSNMVGREPPDNWICSHNPDTRHNKCTIKEEVPQIQEAVFKKEEKTSEQQRLEIQAKMDKFQRELDQVNKQDTRFKHVEGNTSSREQPREGRRLTDDNDWLDDRPSRDRRVSAGRRKRMSSSDEKEEESSEEVATKAGFKRRDFPTSSRMGKKAGLPSRPRLPSSPTIKKKKMRKRLVQHDSDSEDDASASPNGDDENDEESDVGKVVEYNDGKKWQPGRVISTKTKDDGKHLKIKFDNHTQDRFDKWVKDGSSLLRFADVVTNGKSHSSKTPKTERPDDERMPSADAIPRDLHENALEKLRTCLRYFLPPQWKQPKEEINGLSLQELVDFPMDDFFDHYEKGLRRLVSNFRSQADQQKTQADTLRQQLSDTQQLLYDVLMRLDKDTPEMTHEDLVPYARRYLDNT